MTSLFRNSIPQNLRLPLLIVALFPHLMLLSMFNMNSTFSASVLDVEVDDLQFLFALGYGTIVCALFIHMRFFQFFDIRNYLLLMTTLSIVLLTGMTMTTNTQLVIALRWIQGPLALLEGAILLPVIMSQLKPDYSRVVAYAILYCYMMTGDKFSLSLVKFALENYSYNMMLYVMIVMHLATVLIYLLCFNQHRIFPKKPLYRLHLSGIFLLMISLLSGAYALIYGRKYDWFESASIVWAAASCLLFGALFLFYQKSIKLPMFDFSVFRSKKVLVGIGIFLLFYILRGSMSNLYQVMATVWQWPWTNILDYQYYNVYGTILGVAISVIFLLKKVNYKYIFAIGFTFLTVALYWFSTLFYPDISYKLVLTPLFFMGIGQGIIFTPLVMFMMGSVPANLTSYVSVIGTSIRFWSTIISYAIFQNLIMHTTMQKQANLSSQLESNNPIFVDAFSQSLARFGSQHISNDAMHLAASSFQNILTNQAMLLANIDIFTWLSIIGSMLVFLSLMASWWFKQIAKISKFYFKKGPLFK